MSPFLAEVLEEAWEKNKRYIPPYIKENLDAYASPTRQPIGGCLQAILENDLRGAFSRADDTVQACMFGIVNYIYNELPANCWGSPERVTKWLKRRENE
jgi:hypothetical protein